MKGKWNETKVYWNGEMKEGWNATKFTGKTE